MEFSSNQKSSTPKVPPKQATDERSHRYRLDTMHLQLGMFVAELDRPWLDTPFVIEGLQIGNSEELSTLQSICRYVYVDLKKSNSSLAQKILDAHELTLRQESSPKLFSSFKGEKAAIDRKSEDRPKPFEQLDAKQHSRLSTDKKIQLAYEKIKSRDPSSSGEDGRRRYKARSDISITKETRGRFKDLLQNIASSVSESFADKTLRWIKERFFSAVSPQEQAARDRKIRQEIRTELLKTKAKEEAAKLRFVSYKDSLTASEEAPRARIAFSKSEQTLGKLLADIKTGKVPQIEAIKESVDSMVESMVANPDAMLWISRMREEHQTTYQHGVKVALYMVALGRHLGFPKNELTNLGLIGILADVGKTRLPKQLLEKPGMLTKEEFLLVKEHVRLGLEALKETSTLPTDVELGIAQHHERMDGSGYPAGLVGDAISVFGRIAAIADCFAALTTPRPYANPQAPQEALMSLYEWGEKSLHSPLVEQFVQAVSVFPVGSTVELSSGEVCVVLAHNRARRLEPKVIVLTWPDKSPLATPVERDLMMQPRDVSNKPIRIIRGLPAGAYGLKIRDFYGNELAAANKLF